MQIKNVKFRKKYAQCNSCEIVSTVYYSEKFMFKHENLNPKWFFMRHPHTHPHTHMQVHSLQILKEQNKSRQKSLHAKKRISKQGIYFTFGSYWAQWKRERERKGKGFERCHRPLFPHTWDDYAKEKRKGKKNTTTVTGRVDCKQPFLISP